MEDIADIKSEIILEKRDDIFKVIGKNLLDGIVLENINGTENVKSILYDREQVGKVEVLEECKPDMRIRVEVYNNIDEFIIQDTLKMYSIISFINTKFNYKQE